MYDFVSFLSPVVEVNGPHSQRQIFVQKMKKSLVYSLKTDVVRAMVNGFTTLLCPKWGQVSISTVWCPRSLRSG